MSARPALLFDLDGTLVDTDVHHMAAWNDVLAPMGRAVDHDGYRRNIMGFTNDAILAWLFGAAAARHAEMPLEKERRFRARLDRLEPAAGLTALLAEAARRDWPCAVVTNAPRDNAELMLQGLGLATRFPVLVIGDELPRGKPDPLPYRTAMDRLGVSAAESIAFEDSLSGIRAAAGAGVFTVGMLSALPEQALRAAGASMVVRDFTDPALLRRLGL
jgi:HAD superfamily hydrolase (TIGR01509 family)